MTTMRSTAILLLAIATVSAHAAPQRITVIDEAGRPVTPAAVSVVVQGSKPAATSTGRAEMAQKSRTFVPGMLVVQTGTLVHFPNFDTVRHHVYSFSPTKPFEIKLYAGTPSAPIAFDKAGTATLGCNIHDKMLGYIHVVDTPYFGATDAAGQVTLDLPAGEHRLRVWTPAMGETAAPMEQVIKVGAPIVVTLKK